MNVSTHPALRALALAAALVTAAPSALACSTCACGDYSITVTGLEKPYAGRLRGSLDGSSREESTGAGATLETIEEQRYTLGLSWSPDERLTFSAQLPWVRKHIVDAGGSLDTDGLGDADLVARLVTFRSEGPVPRHLAGVRLGVRLPTAELVRDGSGAPLDPDAQPGPRAAAPNLGAWYGYYRLPFLLSASVAYLDYATGAQDFRPGNATVGSLTAQYGWRDWAGQLGLDARHSRPNAESGVDEENTGGTLVMGTVGIARRFGEDLVLNAAWQTPVVTKLYGEQDEENAFRVGIAYDFH